MAVENKDVIRVFDTPANLAANLKNKMFGFDSTGIRFAAKDASGTMRYVSHDSLQCLLAGTQTITGIKTFSANTFFTGSITLGGINPVSSILDEDDFVSNSATGLATQRSTKAYVDAKFIANDLDIAGDTGTGNVDLTSQVLTLSGTANEIETSASGQTITVGLPNSVTISSSLGVAGSPSYTLHVNEASSGLTAAPNNDNVVIEGTGLVGLTILGDNAGGVGITLGYTDSNSKARFYSATDETNLSNNTTGGITFSTNVGTQAVRIDENQRMAIGLFTGADTLLHVYEASAGTVSADANTQVAIENSTIAGINILSGTEGRILFGIGTNNAHGGIKYDTTDYLTFRTNSTDDQMKLDSGGTLTTAGSIIAGSTITAGGTLNMSSNAITNNTIIGNGLASLAFVNNTSATISIGGSADLTITNGQVQVDGDLVLGAEKRFNSSSVTELGAGYSNGTNADSNRDSVAGKSVIIITPTGAGTDDFFGLTGLVDGAEYTVINDGCVTGNFVGATGTSTRFSVNVLTQRKFTYYDTISEIADIYPSQV